MPFEEEISGPDAFLRAAREFIQTQNAAFSSLAAEQGFENGYDCYVNQLIQTFKETPLADLVKNGLPFLADADSVETIMKCCGAYEKEYVARNTIVMNKVAALSGDVSQVNPKHLVINYGVGHMYFFEAELCKIYGLELVEEEWITAVIFRDDAN